MLIVNNELLCLELPHGTKLKPLISNSRIIYEPKLTAIKSNQLKANTCHITSHITKQSNVRELEGKSTELKTHQLEV